MSRFTAENSVKLHGLLEEETELLVQIEKLTDEQTGLLADGGVGRFKRALDRRQGLLDKLGGLHQESDVLMQSYVSAGEKQKTIEQKHLKIRSMLAAIIEKDKKNLAAAQELSEQLAGQINKLSMSRKSIGLYNQGAEYGGGHFDKST